jgi:transposase
MIGMLERKDIISKYEQTGSIRAVAKELEINRKTVKNYVTEYLEAKSKGDEQLVAYLKSEPRYKVRKREKYALTDEVSELIDICLKDNRLKRFRGDQKLCMKADDIHAKLIETGYKVSYSSVCRYIRNTLGHADEIRECYIRQHYEPGYDCEFDWGELYLTIDRRRTKFYMAVFTMPYSNYRTAYLFLHQDTQAFLESHRRYFREIGHVPHRMVYDNMRVAVASFVGGKTPTEALLRMEATYGFTHRFCNIRSGNEKGHVERSVEVVRRKAFCRIDSYNSIKEADTQIIYACGELNTPFGEYEQSAEQKMEEEYRHMLPLLKEIGCFEQQSYTVDKYGTVVIKGIHYSVPDTLVGRKVNVMLYSNRIKVYSGNEIVAEHERNPLNGWKLDLMHYIRTFQAKPGSIAGSTALYMANDEFKEIFHKYFEDNPSDFILLLRKAKDKGFTPEDIMNYCDLIRNYGMHVSLDAFNQLMFSEGTVPIESVRGKNGESEEIEHCACDGLTQLTEIMNDCSTSLK